MELNEELLSVITITDTGCGIPDEDHEKIFQESYSKNKIDDDASHLGLGLTIVDNIVKDHQGEIRVFSKENNNTRFEIRFKSSPVAVIG